MWDALQDENFLPQLIYILMFFFCQCFENFISKKGDLLATRLYHFFDASEPYELSLQRLLISLLSITAVFVANIQTVSPTEIPPEISMFFSWLKALIK